MKRYLLLFLMLCMPALAAITERYVEVISAWANSTAYTTTPLSLVIGSDGNAYYCISAHTSETGVKGRPVDGTDYATYWTICDGSSTKPWSLSQAFAAMAAGDRVNIKTGTYTRTATDTISNDGTVVSPIIVRGYKTSIGDLDPGGGSEIVRTNGGALVTTNMPLINYDAAHFLDGSGSDYLVLANLNVIVDPTGIAGPAIKNTGACSVTYHCVAHNTNTNSGAGAISCGSSGSVISCDGTLVSSAGSVFSTGSANALFSDCHVLAGSGSGFGIGQAGAVLDHCVCPGVAVQGVRFSSTTASHTPPILLNCTIYGSGTGGTDSAYATIKADGANTSIVRILNSILTGATEYGINNKYSATSHEALLSVNNSLKNVTGEVNGYTDWYAGAGFGTITPTTTTSEFTDAGGLDFRLLSNALSVKKGNSYMLDIGAFQLSESGSGGAILGGFGGGFD